MSPTVPSGIRRRLAPLVLLGSFLGAGVLLAAWKYDANATAEAAAGKQPEPVELVTLASAEPREYRPTTTAVGTVLALQSVTLRNELAGTVRRASLTAGRIVEPGTVLVALDVSEEEAELRELEAQATLAQTTLERLEKLRQFQATSQEEVDQARAQREMAEARMARVRAVIAKKTIRAPFRARVGISDVHQGQYLTEGTEITTLQGVAEAVHVDFEVSQAVASTLRPGTNVQVVTGEGSKPIAATVMAIDARVDPTTRNATVRARLAGTDQPPAPGASVRVTVPVGQTETAVAIPVSALRKTPGGDQVWLVAADSTGKRRAHARTVQSGPVLGDTVVILQGLEAGDELAASGSFKLREAVRIEAAPADSTVAAPAGKE